MLRETLIGGQKDLIFRGDMPSKVLDPINKRRQIREAIIVLIASHLIPLHDDFSKAERLVPPEKRYARQFLTIKGSSTNSNLGKLEIIGVDITFSEKDVRDIHPHNDDHMVITMRCDKLRD